MTDSTVPVEEERHRAIPGGAPPPLPMDDGDRWAPRPHGAAASAPATPGADALARLTVELDEMGRANAELLRVATEFQKLTGALGGAREAPVATMVAGVKVHFPAAAVLGAKQTELRGLSDGWERTLLHVLTAIGSLLQRSEEAAAPLSGRAAAGQPPPDAGPAALFGGDAAGGELFDEIAEALARQGPTGFRVRIPGQSATAPGLLRAMAGGSGPAAPMTRR